LDDPEEDGFVSYRKTKRVRSWQEILKEKIGEFSSMTSHKIDQCLKNKKVM
jgi:hypothetical protein